ncbi:hypothetical protein Q3C01_12285 [Bradyrhizobium sp. UFLA05-109]
MLTAAVPPIAKIAELLGGDVQGAEVLCPGPGHSAGDRSLSVKPDPADREGFVTHSFAGDDWKDCRDYVRNKLGLPEPEKGSQRQQKKTGGGKRAWSVLDEYIYRDQNGEPFLKVRKCRDETGKKEFPQYHWDGNEWVKGKPDGPKIPYRLPQLLASPVTATIYFCEGEKDADTLAKIDFVATTASEGAAAKWDPELTQYFADRDVVILPDADRPGRAHAQKVAKAIHAVAASVRILDLYPERHDGSDVSDFIADAAAGGRLAKEAKEAPLWGPSGPTTSAAVVDGAELLEKPRLLVENHSPDRTVAALRDMLANAGGLYDRGVPVRLAFDQIQRGTVAQSMTPDVLVLMAHTICRPYALKVRRDGTVDEVDVRLPRPLAVMYLDWRGEWQLPPLNGIASAPQLQDDGTINSTEGYDCTTGMWCENMPDLTGLVPASPSMAEAAAALRSIRDTFKTFCFADAAIIDCVAGGVATVDTSKAPARDESSFLVALLTAVCRPSLHLAPGLLLRAAPVSGAGAGKGLLARCMCIIAFGREPHAVTGGANADELEKRIAAELIEGSPALFLDNLNNRAFRSELLASAITERPARVRLLGRSQMVPLNASAFVILTGNGLTVSEDLARRFLTVSFDARTEDPELRPFATDIRVEVRQRRAELLAALLTIWRWGRIARNIKPGMELGSFAQWCRWVRDPLLALGCQDPVERIGEAKQRDARRQEVADLFAIWWDKHGDNPVPIRQLHEDVRHALDPQGRGRQYVASKVDKLTGTRMAGLVLTRQASTGTWGAATYALTKSADRRGHRDHGGHREESPPECPYDPYGPYADGDRTVVADTLPSDSTAQPANVGDDEDGGHRSSGSGPETMVPGWRMRL